MLLDSKSPGGPVWCEAGIVGVEVEWHVGCGNPPELVVRVDYSESERVRRAVEAKGLWTPHRLKGGCTLYVRREEFCRVSYLLHNRRNETGFGGRRYTLETPEGAVEIKGPWSSSARAVKYRTGLDIMEVEIIDKDGLHAIGAILSDRVLAAVKHFRPDLDLQEVDPYGNGELRWQIANEKPEHAERVAATTIGVVPII